MHGKKVVSISKEEKSRENVDELEVERERSVSRVPKKIEMSNYCFMNLSFVLNLFMNVNNKITTYTFFHEFQKTNKSRR